jgi:nucleotide-binding universal stress UspA family protein
MLRRILILLGETPSSASSRQYALRLSQKTGAELAGLSGIDLPYIEALMPGRIGATAYKAKLEERLKKQANEQRVRLHEVFVADCRFHGLVFDWLSFEGDPMEALSLAAETCDLLITGHDTSFRGEAREQLSEILGKLLLITPRPIVVCPDEPIATDQVLVAYDGSLPSMRTLQMFALLGLGRGQNIQVVSIDAHPELAAKRAANAANYLRMHSHQVDTSPVSTRARPAEALKSEIANRKAGMLVMGAYGHRGFREFMFGSTTSTLVEDPPCALFLYH